MRLMGTEELSPILERFHQSFGIQTLGTKIRTDNVWLPSLYVTGKLRRQSTLRPWLNDESVEEQYYQVPRRVIRETEIRTGHHHSR